MLGGWEGCALGTIGRRPTDSDGDDVLMELHPLRGHPRRCSGCGRTTTAVHETAGLGATWQCSIYEYAASSDTPPSPLPAPLATNCTVARRITVGNVGAGQAAPYWSVGIAEYRSYDSGDDRWRLLMVDERLPVVACDPGVAT